MGWRRRIISFSRYKTAPRFVLLSYAQRSRMAVRHRTKWRRTMRAFSRTPTSQKTASSRYQEPTRQVLAMTASRFIVIDGKRLVRRDILRIHKQQMLRNLLTTAMRVESGGLRSSAEAPLQRWELLIQIHR